jgi:hypothetical protein
MRRLKFSLRTFVLIILVAALALGIGVNQYKKQKLRREMNDRYRLADSAMLLIVEPAQHWGKAMKKPVIADIDRQENSSGWKIKVSVDNHDSETGPPVPSIRMTMCCNVEEGRAGPVRISGLEGSETQLVKRVIGKALKLANYEFLIEDE